MRIAFDIGGVLSKYPDEFRKMIIPLAIWHEIFVITDMHDKAEVVKMLQENNFGLVACITEDHIYTADYATYGEMCKAVLLRDLKIDVFIDDFVGYMQWDSSFGPAPIRLLIMPDARKPYWHETWKAEGGDFGRRKFTEIDAASDKQLQPEDMSVGGDNVLSPEPAPQSYAV
jgi:hypothetical protein